jgi:hypothetical protein
VIQAGTGKEIWNESSSPSWMSRSVEKERKERREKGMKTHDNMVTALLGTVLTKLIDSPL